MKYLNIKMFAIVGIATVGLMLAAQAAHADAIGYIDVKKVFTGYTKTQKAQADLEAKEKEYAKAFDEKNKKIQEEKEKSKSDADIQKLVKAAEEELEPQKKAIIELNNRVSNELQQDIVRAVEAISKELGIDVVLDKQVLIVGGTDLTELVIARLNTKK